MDVFILGVTSGVAVTIAARWAWGKFVKPRLAKAVDKVAAGIVGGRG